MSYPSTLPLPRLATIQAAERRVLSTQPGRREAAPLQRDRLYTQQAEFVFTPAEAAVFMAWWRIDLVSGGCRFEAGWPSPQGVPLVRQFLGPPRFAGYTKTGLWLMSASFEVLGRHEGLATEDFSALILLLHGNGSSGSTDIVDDSPVGRAPSVLAGVEINTGVKVFGTGSLYSSSSSGILQYASSSDFRTTDSWTLEFRVRVPAFGDSVFFMATHAGRYFAISSLGVLSSANWGGDFGNQLVLDTWHAVKVTYDSVADIAYGYFDGALEFTDAGGFLDPDARPFNVFHVPARPDLNGLTGYIDELRFERRYIAGGSVAAEEFPNP